MRNLGFMFLLMILSQSSFILNAQNENWCGTYEKIEEFRKLYPEYDSNQEKLERFTEEYLKNKPVDKGVIYTIPIVFHIIHNYGPENISLETVDQTIKNLNDIYRKRKSNLSSVKEEFQGIIADCEIEFKLAKIDPYGNCTQGVTRTNSLVTYTAEYELYSVAPSWDNNKYLNVWLVNQIPGGVAGWSTGVGGSPSRDGLVFEYSAINGYTFAHEVAHSFSIAHTWGPTNDPNITSNCSMDDGISDTPETIGSAVGACNKNQTTCGSLDNVQNIMDYSGCKLMFTEGQKQKMRATLNSNVGGRNNLWTEENLIATGTMDGYVGDECDLIADFGWDKNNGCQGVSIQFNDYSYNGTASAWSWEFEGGEPSTSTGNNPLVTFANPGEFNVSLTVTNDNGTSTIVKENIIVTNDTVQGIVYPYLEDFQRDNVLDIENEKAWLVNNEDAQGDGWDIYSIGNNKAMKASLMLTYNENLSTIISPNINISNATDLTHFNFKVAYAKRLNDSNDELKVYLSKDCGKTWALKYLKSGNALVTNDGELSTNFEPTEDQWSNERISLTNFDNVNHFMIKFVVETAKGGTLYLDDIKFGEIETSMQKIDMNSSMKLYPNPSNGRVKIHIRSTKNDNASINILNISGAQVFSKNVKISQGDNILNLSDLYNFEKGIYIIQIINSSNIHSQKLILY